MDRLEMAILELLLRNDEYITYNLISKKLNVSTRTVLRFVKKVHSYIKTFNIKIETKKGKGVKLIGSSSNLEKLKSSLQKQSVFNLSDVERRTTILCELFNSKDYVKLYYLSYLLNVSIGTINRDLDSVSTWLEKNKLRLEVSRGRGIKISGNRHHIRQAIVNLLIQSINLKKIPLIANDTISVDLFNDALYMDVRKSLLKLFNLKDFQKTMKYVNEFDYTLVSTFVYEDYFKFIMYIHLLLHKTGMNDMYEECVINLKLRENDQYLRMKEFAKKIKKVEGIIIPESDICNLTAIYLSMRPNEYVASVYNYDEEIYQATLQFLNEMEKDLNLRLNRDEYLIGRLVTHLKLMLKRIQMSVVIENNYLNVVKKEYPKVFALVKKNIEQFSLKKGITVNEDEIGYISLYILANIMKQENENHRIRAVILCINGIGTSKMLKHSIMNNMPMIDVAGEISINGLNEAQLANDGIDLIISTIKIDTVIIPNILVNPLMLEDDFLLLNKKCQEIASKNKIFKGNKHTQVQPDIHNKESQGITDSLQKLRVMHEILSQFHYRTIKVESMDQLLKLVSKDAFLDESLQKECIKELEHRESLGSTVIDKDGVILLHCKLENEIRLHFYSLANPMDYLINNRLIKIDKVVLMIVPYNSGDMLLRQFSTVSESLVQDKKIIGLINEGSEEKIFKYLCNMLFNSIL